MYKKYLIFKYTFIFFLISFLFCNLHAQKTNQKSLNTKTENKIDDSFKKVYENLLIKSQNVLKENPSDFTSVFNTGYANYKLGKHEEALKYFLRALNFTDKNKIKATVHYNIGNTYFMLKKLKQALLQYRKGLIYKSWDQDTRYNYTVTKMILDNAKNQKKQNKKQKDNQNKKNKNNKNKKDSQKQKKQNKKKFGKMNKEDAMRILNALKNKEKKSMPKKVFRIRGVKKDKDW